MADPKPINEGLAELEAKQLETTSLEPSSSQNAMRLFNESARLAVKAQILEEIGQAENENQTHLTEFERNALLSWLMNQGWPIEKIRRARLQLIYVKKFAKLAPEHWVEAVDEPLYTESDLGRESKRLLEETTERNRKAYVDIHGQTFDQAWIIHLEKEGLRSAQQMSERRLAELRRVTVDGIDKRIRSARRFILMAADPVKDDLFSLLIAKYGRFNDGHCRKYLHVCAPFLLDEVEQMRKRMPQS